MDRLVNPPAADVMKCVLLLCTFTILFTLMDSLSGLGVFINQVPSVGRQLSPNPSCALEANHVIGPSTVSDPSFTSEDSRTFSERRRGWLIYCAPDDASAVDYTKEDMDNDDDGVVDSPPIQAQPITATPHDQIPVMTVVPEGPLGEAVFRNSVVDGRAHLARLDLNSTLPYTAPRGTLSLGRNPCLQRAPLSSLTHRLLRRRAVKRHRDAAFLGMDEAIPSKYTRSEEPVFTMKAYSGATSSRPRGDV